MAKEWVDRFFTGLYGQVLAHQFDEKRSLAQARLVKRLLRARTGQEVLDVPCGQGRLTIPLARMGLRMTGVDLTASFIRKARRLTRKAALRARYDVKDMREIDFDGEFDAALNFFTSIGYASDADDLEFCRRVYRALKPGGRFLVETMNKSWLLSHYRTWKRDVTMGGVRVVEWGHWDARTGRNHSTWVFQRGRRRERHHLVLRLFDGADIRKLLREAGFRDIRLYGHPPVGRLSRHSRRLIAVGVRPPT